MADRHGYGSRRCYVVRATRLGNFFFAPHLSRCQNLSKPECFDNIRPVSAHAPVMWLKSWSRGLSGRLAGWQTPPEHTWLKLPRCLFFLQLALYPVNSALLVDSAHPGFCVPSSFHWLDLRRLFAGYPNGFRQLLELVWAPEALTKSTLYPALAGMGSSIISQEADLEVLRGQKKAQVRCPSKNRNSE